LSHGLRSAVRSLCYRRVTYAPGNPKLWGPGGVFTPRCSRGKRGKHPAASTQFEPVHTPVILPTCSPTNQFSQISKQRNNSGDYTAGSVRCPLGARGRPRLRKGWCRIMGPTSWEPPKCPLLRHTVSLETLMLVSCSDSRSSRRRRPERKVWNGVPQNTQHCCDNVNRIAYPTI